MNNLKSCHSLKDKMLDFCPFFLVKDELDNSLASGMRFARSLTHVPRKWPKDTSLRNASTSREFMRGYIDDVL